MSMTATAFLILIVVMLLRGLLMILDICSESWIRSRIDHLERRIEKLRVDAQQHWSDSDYFDAGSFDLSVASLEKQISKYETRLKRIVELKAINP
jgi:hypothetical protein